MPTGKGFTIDSKNIVNRHGNEIKFENDLPPCTPIWIYYDDRLRVKNIERQISDLSPEDNPSVRKEDIIDEEDGDGGV